MRPTNKKLKSKQHGVSSISVGGNDVKEMMFVWQCIISTTMKTTNKIQQLFRLLIFLIQPYMFRRTNSPILMSTFWMYIQLLVQCTDTAADRCYGGTDRQQNRQHCTKSCVYSQKCSWGWANLSPETCRADLKRLINEIVVASCWLFTSM